MLQDSRCPQHKFWQWLRGERPEAQGLEAPRAGHTKARNRRKRVPLPTATPLVLAVNVRGGVCGVHMVRCANKSLNGKRAPSARGKKRGSAQTVGSVNAYECASRAWTPARLRPRVGFPALAPNNPRRGRAQRAPRTCRGAMWRDANKAVADITTPQGAEHPDPLHAQPLARPPPAPTWRSKALGGRGARASFQNSRQPAPHMVAWWHGKQCGRCLAKRIRGRS